MRQKGFVLLPVIIITLLVGALGYFIYQNAQLQNSNTTSTKSSLPKDELVSRGIHPDSVDIKVLEDITAQWQDKSVAYTLERSYLTPDIADLGPYRDNESVKGKNFLVIQLNVRDRRTVGDRKLVTAGDYLRLRQDKQDMTPIDNDYLYLSPQENGTVYIVFPVDTNMSQFALLIGILSSPKVTNLNFDGTTASSLKGVFLLKQGFSSEYKE